MVSLMLCNGTTTLFSCTTSACSSSESSTLFVRGGGITDSSHHCSSGEFHTFRLPVPELWLDIFQRMVAAGMNGVRYVVRISGLRSWGFDCLPCSIYIHCENSFA